MPAMPGTTSHRLAALGPGWHRRCLPTGLRGWLGPLLVTAFARFLRSTAAVPRALVFDET